MKRLGFHNKRHTRYIIIAGLTLLVMVLFQLFKPEVLPESVEQPEESNNLGLYLILALLLLSGLLVYVSLNDFGKRSLIRIRLTRINSEMQISITNVSGKTQCFSEFEIQLEDWDKNLSNQKFHLKKELVIAHNKKWISNLDQIDLERKIGTDYKPKRVRLKLTGNDGINYFSNKLRLT